MANITIDFLADISGATKEIAKLGSSVDKQVSQISAAFGTLGKTIAGLAATIGVGLSFKAAIDSAAKYEDAVNGLSTALKLTGIESKEATQSIVDFASQIQATTRFSDDAVLGAASLLQGIARLTDEGLKLGTQAAINLSSALRIDLDSAVRLVGKAAEGNVEAFRRYGIEVQKGKNDSETFANVLNVLSERFGGAAVSATNSYAGALDQLRNNFDDVLKSFGLGIIQNDEFIAAIKSLSAAFASFVPIAAEAGVTLAKGVVKTFQFLSENGATIKGILAGLATAVAAIASVKIIAAFAALDLSIVGLATGLGGAAVAARAFWAALLGPVGLAIAGVTAVAAAVGIYVAKTQEATKENKKLNDEIKKQADAGSRGVSSAGQVSGQGLKLSGGGLDASELKKARDEFARFSKEIVKNSTDALGQVRLREAEQLKALKDFRKQGILSVKEFNDTELRIRETAARDIEKINAQITKDQIEQQKAQRDFIKQSSSSLLDFFVNIKDTFARFGTEGVAATLAGAVASSISQGAEGARKFVVSALTAAATAVLGPVGEALGPVFDVLSQGPEQVKQFVQSFTDALPTIIENIALALPELIIGLVDAVPLIIEKLIASIPRIIDGFIAALPRLISSLISQTPRIIAAIVEQMPKVAGSFLIALIKGIPDIVRGIVDGIKNAFGALFGGGGGGLLGGITKGIGKVFRFAEGGIVPGGAPFTDRVPALLSPGEVVLNREQQKELARERVQGGELGGGSGQPLTINLQVGEEQLAQVLVNLTRQGFRLSGV